MLFAAFSSRDWDRDREDMATITTSTIVGLSIALCFLGACALDHQVDQRELNETPNNPIKKAWYREAAACTDASGRSERIKVPTRVEARFNSLASRKNFGSAFNTVMTKRCAERKTIGGRSEAIDEKGHLVASEFNGPITWYNLVPQHRTVNRNHDQSKEKGAKLSMQWVEMEREASCWLQCGPNHEVEWIVDVEYAGDNPRPTAFKLHSKLYDGRAVQYETAVSVSNSGSSSFYIKGSHFNQSSVCTRLENDQKCSKY